MAEDGAGALYVSDASAGRVYRIGGDGLVTTFAGGGGGSSTSNGDEAAATQATLFSPRGLAFDSRGNLCNRLRWFKITRGRSHTSKVWP